MVMAIVGTQQQVSLMAIVGTQQQVGSLAEDVAFYHCPVHCNYHHLVSAVPQKQVCIQRKEALSPHKLERDLQRKENQSQIASHQNSNSDWRLP
jgi:hypothetical protein